MPTIINGSTATPYYFKEGCTIVELSNTEADAAVSIAEARVAMNTTTRWHCLRATWERYYILQGKGRVELGSGGDQLIQCVAAKDTVIIPPDTAQRIANIGDQELVFLAICSPRFTTVNYTDLEDSQTVSASPVEHQQL